jgi:hypothetical protein
VLGFVTSLVERFGNIIFLLRNTSVNSIYFAATWNMGFDSQEGQEHFFFATACSRFWIIPASYPVKSVTLYSGVKPEYEADCLPGFSTEIKMACRCVFTLLYALRRGA